ncbi:MAG: rhodanese-like domain-containing protein [Desulfobacterales bacterium]|nr:rhodanese-like domain-containing protein [Desulfobacterales bacterium]
MIKEMAIIMVCSVVAAFAVNYFSPVGVALIGQWDETQGVITAMARNDDISGNMEINDVVIAKQLYDTKKFVFVDARSDEDYEEGHVKGAVSLPIGQFDELIFSFLDQYLTDTMIVTYCSGRACDESHQLAKLLEGFGYEQVNIMIDGYPAWQERGFPIE